LQVLEDVVSQVFFDLDVDGTSSSTVDTRELVIMIGPAALDFLVEFCTRYHVSVDIIITILQVQHTLLVSFRDRRLTNHRPSLHT
jgi:hypothetical protein